MSTLTRISVASAGLLAMGFFSPSPSYAAFHLMQIEQVIGAVNGNKTAQAVQLRQRSGGQNLISGSRIRVFDATGSNPVVIVNFGSNVGNGAAGARILVCSSAFAAHTTPGASCDFIMENLIPASYLNAGSLVFEFGSTIYWRLSWGGAAYTGSGSVTTNDSDGNANPPFGSALPTNCTMAVNFPGSFASLSTNNAADYVLTAGAATFRNNAGTAFAINPCTGDGNCNDSISCTTNACVSSCCVFTPDNGLCPENGAFCDGEEVCNANLGCVSAGNPCTTPPNLFCDEASDTCGLCGVDGDCEDGVFCTVDDCVSGACVFTPNNASCPPNGLFCDGPEICHPVNNCVSSGDPCGPGEVCNESTDTCDSTVLAIGLKEVGVGGAAAGGLLLSSPLQVTHAGDDRLFVVDQAGYIRIIDDTDVLLPTPFLDLTAKLPALNAGFDERGLLGLAFHPDYLSNGKFYVRYSTPRTSTGSEPCDMDSFGCHKEVVAQYTVLGDPTTSNVADATSEVVFFTWDKPQWNHNAGHIAFGLDGYLYWSSGDGGGANDGLSDSPPSHGPNGNAQNIDSPMGKILRIDVNSGSPYSVPLDNPFVGGPGLDEIYAYGFRNPYKFSFDRANGDLYVGDVGQDLFEEVDIVDLGGNYGWVIREGLHCFDPDNPTSPPGSCPTTGAMGEPLLDPVDEYSHSTGGLAVVGGHVYRGMDVPELEGVYVYGDFSADFGPTGRLYYFPTTGPDAYQRSEFNLGGGGPFGKVLKGFGEDIVGEIYVCASDDLGPSGTSGIIYRIVALPTTPEGDPAGLRKNRSLTLSVASAAQTAGPGGMTAIQVTAVDLQHPLPYNVPASVTRNYTTFDTNVNGTCANGAHAGHHCDTAADCRLCGGSGSNANKPCTSDAVCTAGGQSNFCPTSVCSGDARRPCSNNGHCTGFGTCNAPLTYACGGLAACTGEAAMSPAGVGGCARWVGKPETFPEAQEVDLGTYRGSRLQCTPFYYDFGSESLLHIIGAEILPSSTYEVRNYSADCAGIESTCTFVSPPVSFKTSRAGDVVAFFNPPDNSQQPDVTDIGQVVAKFKKQAGSPSNTRALIQPNIPDPNSDVGVSDIVQVVDMAKQFVYPFGGPCPCPSLAVCGATPCPSGAGTCIGSGAPGLGAEATCVKLCRTGTTIGEQCNNHTHCGGGGICDKECVGGTNNAQGCSGSQDCGKVCVGGPTPGAPCVDASTCGGGTCPAINCVVVTNNAFCRDRCGRCTPP